MAENDGEVHTEAEEDGGRVQRQSRQIEPNRFKE